MKKLLTRLSRIFAYNIKDYYPFCLIVILLFTELLINNHYFNIFIIIILLLFMLKKNKHLIYFLVILLSFITINFLIKSVCYNSLKYGPYEGVARVTKTISYDDYQKVYLKINSSKVYYINKYKNLKAGDKIYVKGKIKEALKCQLPGEFDYSKYLRFNGVKGIIEIDSYDYLSHGFSIYRLNEIIVNYIKRNYKKESSLFINALLFGDKSGMDDNLEKQIQTLGIGHLFVVSGLHVSIIVGFLSFILNKTKLNDNLKFLIISFVLGFYYFVCGLLISVLRVLLSTILGHYFKFKSTIHKLSLNAIIVLLINPFYVTNYSFLLSYTIVFGIGFLSPYLKNGGFLNSIKNQLAISTLGLIISLPITSSISFKTNLLSILFNIFYIPFVTYIFLPASILSLAIKPLEYFYNYLIKFFLFLTKYLSKINILTINVPRLTYYYGLIFMFFTILFFYIKKKRISIISLIAIIIISANINLVNPNLYIYFMSVYNGDSTLIVDSFNRANILIDTGDYGSDDMITFLKHKNIKSLDAVIITHGDSDHCGMISDLDREFRIKNIYISGTDRVLKQRLEKRGLSYINVFKGDKLKIKKNCFYFIHPDKEYSNINNNSLTFIYSYNDFKILFTGDIEKEAEEVLFKNSRYKVDILKIPHHGSNTSSTSYLFRGVRFNYAVAMNGYSAKFDFPNPAIRKKYEDLLGRRAYFTRDHGTVYVKKSVFSKKWKIFTCY